MIVILQLDSEALSDGSMALVCEKIALCFSSIPPAKSASVKATHYHKIFLLAVARALAIHIKRGGAGMVVMFNCNNILSNNYAFISAVQRSIL